MQLEPMQRFGEARAVAFWGSRSTNDTVAAAAAAHPGFHSLRLHVAGATGLPAAL